MNLTAIPTIKTITDLRYQAPVLFNFLKKKGRPVYITRNSRTVGVLLSPKIFAQLIEVYEDWRDQKIIDETVTASSKKDFLNFIEFDKKQKKKLKIS